MIMFWIFIIVSEIDDSPLERKWMLGGGED